MGANVAEGEPLLVQVGWGAVMATFLPVALLRRVGALRSLERRALTHPAPQGHAQPPRRSMGCISRGAKNGRVLSRFWLPRGNRGCTTKRIVNISRGQRSPALYFGGINGPTGAAAAAAGPAAGLLRAGSGRSDRTRDAQTRQGHGTRQGPRLGNKAPKAVEAFTLDSEVGVFRRIHGLVVLGAGPAPEELLPGHLRLEYLSVVRERLLYRADG